MTVALVAELNSGSILFPRQRTKVVNTVSATISSDSWEVPDWIVCLYPHALMHAHVAHLLALRNLPLPTLAFMSGLGDCSHSRAEWRND